MAKKIIKEEEYVDCARVKKVLRAMQTDSMFYELAETFKAIGDFTRTKILFALGMEELCVGDIASLVGMSPSAVSHQLRLLRNLKLVRFRKDGKITYYALDDKHIGNLMLEGFKHVSEQTFKGKKNDE